MKNMKILDMVVTHAWYDLHYSGVKNTEYRRDVPYWRKRIKKHKPGDLLQLRRGYSSKSQLKEIKSIRYIASRDVPEPEKSYLKVRDDEPIIAIDCLEKIV